MGEAIEDDGWIVRGIAEGQTVDADWNPVGIPHIDGVVTKEIRPVTVGSGSLTEIWRSEWNLDPLGVGQVFQRLIDPGVVTGWHAHERTTDRLFCAAGRIRVSLYDGRKASPTAGTVWQRVFGQERPLLMVIPPGVWHGVTALGAAPALVLNLVDRGYAYDSPDHMRLPPDTPHIPLRLI